MQNLTLPKIRIIYLEGIVTYKSKITGLVTVMLFVVFFSSSAYALLIEFTDGSGFVSDNDQDWSGVGGASDSGMVGGINVNLSTTGGVLTFNGGGSDTPPGVITLLDGGFLKGDGDGLGVLGIDDTDEVNHDETLTVSFDNPLKVLNIYVLDLFNQEVVDYSFDSGSFSSSEFGNASWGFLEIETLSNNLTSNIVFSVNNDGSGDDADHDYAVAGINIAPVPEPATMLLFGTGLLGLAGLRLRKKK
jgi:hypothetical protein